MNEEYQIEISLSYIALFVDAGQQWPNASREVVAWRDKNAYALLRA